MRPFWHQHELDSLTCSHNIVANQDPSHWICNWWMVVRCWMSIPSDTQAWYGRHEKHVPGPQTQMQGDHLQGENQGRASALPWILKEWTSQKHTSKPRETAQSSLSDPENVRWCVRLWHGIYQWPEHRGKDVNVHHLDQMIASWYQNEYGDW